MSTLLNNANVGSSNNSPSLATFDAMLAKQQQQQLHTTQANKQSSMSSSLTASSTSSSSSDLVDLQGDLLADLWQTSTNDSVLSNTVYTKQPQPLQPAQSLFGQQPQQQSQPNLFNPNPVYTTQKPNWTSSNVSISPPVMNPLSQHYQKQSNSLSQGFSAPLTSTSPSLSMDTFNMYDTLVVPRLYDDEASFSFAGQQQQQQKPQHPAVQFTIPNDNDELFNFEHQHQLQQQHHLHQHQFIPTGINSPPIAPSPQQQQPQPHFHKQQQQEFVNQKIQANTANINTQLYKTELCASFMKMGVCPYGNKCQFAHGENELKKVDRPPKWRSKPCANWTKYGSCRYGNRCCFKHGD
ncbi:uncharacterized protein J8A68_001631 [[Candida] subhashii]|uniref:C3H1-type domain-containing protein n=1 Tax=[Candida] subhashii TaxID=561895 RepID=A0A8J5QFR6_9ASCO|nr:uncharacterized protein J8A68_001631 [[Candida] subhashii]KAG7664814.1 hypothetical protein J8A68_001631 [[Candida] subhashii]